MEYQLHAVEVCWPRPPILLQKILSLISNIRQYLLKSRAYTTLHFKLQFASSLISQYFDTKAFCMKATNKQSGDTLLNSLIYFQLTPDPPTRYQMIKFSTWRVYLYNELQGISPTKRDNKKAVDLYSKQFPQISISEERAKFYDFIYKLPQSYKDFEDQNRKDNISHFICRMLYCQQEGSYQTYVEVEKRILQGRLRRMLRQNNHSDRQILMQLMKKMLVIFKTKQNSSVYNVSLQQWAKMKEFITFSTLIGKRKDEYARLYAKLPFNQAEAGIRKRRSFIRGASVYVNTESMIDVVITNYGEYLKKKLRSLRPMVGDLIIEDTQNQFSSFLISTIKQINEQGMDETKFNGKFNLTLRNIDSLNKYFPPCMLNLNQHLKINRHLKHDGRRQLWGFFKACGMDVHENKQYFRKHLEGKVTASQMKTHMYHIEHAYGLQGKKKAQGAWICRNIITSAAPKKGQHHGCPFYHWRSQELSDYLRKNYRVSEQHLKQIISQKQEKHFQVACGRLFQYCDSNQYQIGSKSQNNMPPQITSKLGRAPYLYFEAAMQLRERKLKIKDGSQMDDKGMREEKNSIQF